MKKKTLKYYYLPLSVGLVSIGTIVPTVLTTVNHNTQQNADLTSNVSLMSTNNGDQQPDQEIKNTSVKKNQIITNNPYVYTNNWTQQDATSFINANLSTIFADLPDGAKVVNIASFNNLDKLNQGIISFNSITISQAYQNNELANNVKFNANFEITGFLVPDQNTIEGFNELNTSVKTTFNINQPNVLAQTLANANQDELDKLKDYLIRQKVVSNPSITLPINVNDFELSVVDTNNTDGTATIKLVFKTFYINGKEVNNKEININLYGFWQCLETTVINNVIIQDNTLTVPTFADQITITQVQNLINRYNPDTFVNNPIYLDKNSSDNNVKEKIKLNPILSDNNQNIKNTQVIANDISFDNLNGLIHVTASIINYSQKTFNDNPDTPLTINFTIDGYYSMKNQYEQSPFTTKINDIWLDNQTSNYALTYNDNKNKINNLIKEVLVDNTVASVINLPPNNPNRLNVTDIKLDDDIQINNVLGSITFNIHILHGKAWIDGNIVDDFVQKVTVYGFKNSQPTTYQDKNIFSALDWKNVNWADVTPDKFKNDYLQQFLSDYRNDIFYNLPLNAIITADGNSFVIDNNEGTVSFNINVDKYYDGSGQLVDGPLNQSVQLIINNLNCGNLNPSNFTTNIKGFNANEPNVLPTDFINDVDYQNKLTTLLIHNNAVSCLPPSNISLDRNDIRNIKIVKADNNAGTLTLDVTVNNIWENGILLDTKVFNNVKIWGFKQQIATTPLDAKLNITADWSTKTVDQFSEADALKFINSSDFIKNQIYIGLPTNAEITIQNFNNSDITNGVATLSVSVNKYYKQNGDSTEYIENASNDQSLIHNITISGFKTTNLLNSTMGNNLNLDISNFYANDINNVKYQDEIINIIKKEIVNNQQLLISNINPQKAISVDNILLSNDINNQLADCVVDGVNGTITFNHFYLDNYVAASNQSTNSDLAYANSVDLGPITIHGFKIQMPTIWENVNLMNSQADNTANVNYLYLDNIDNYYASDLNLNDFNRLINYYQNSFIDNLVPNSLIVKSIDKCNFKQGEVTLTIGVNQYYNQAGQIQDNNDASFHDQQYTIAGFMPWSYSTYVRDVSDPKLFGNKIASQVASNANFQSVLKETIVKYYGITNPNPTIKNFGVNDFTMSILAYDNLNGNIKVAVDFPQNSQAYMQSGKPQQNNSRLEITIGGFRKMQITNIPTITLSPQLINNQTPDQFATAKNFTNILKGQILSVIQPNMFANKITANDIDVKNITSNNNDGTIQANVNIKSSYVAQNGDIVNTPYEQVVTLNGFKVFQQDNAWINDNWWIIVVATVGSVLLFGLFFLLLRRYIKTRMQY